MESMLVSACLMGINCKYSGGSNLCPELFALQEAYQLIPVCPEQLGGLPTPRPPAECREDSVVNNEGMDVTAQFQRGAAEALKVGQLFGCRAAILKTRSPSCGCGLIYDGSFTGTKIPGDGITAKLLMQHGYTIYSEENLPKTQGKFFAEIYLTEENVGDILNKK